MFYFVLQSLESEAYNHHTALYHLLLEKCRQRDTENQHRGVPPTNPQNKSLSTNSRTAQTDTVPTASPFSSPACGNVLRTVPRVNCPRNIYSFPVLHHSGMRTFAARSKRESRMYDVMKDSHRDIACWSRRRLRQTEQLQQQQHGQQGQQPHHRGIISRASTSPGDNFNQGLFHLNEFGSTARTFRCGSSGNLSLMRVEGSQLGEIRLQLDHLCRIYPPKPAATPNTDAQTIPPVKLDHDSQLPCNIADRSDCVIL